MSRLLNPKIRKGNEVRKLSTILIENTMYQIVTNEVQYKENETDLQYALRASELFDKITHWISRENKNEEGETIIKDKGYPFIKSPSDGEYVIVHDDGEESFIYMFTKGDYLVKE